MSDAATTTQREHRGRSACAARGKKAVIYLRVSTPSQVNTDYNPEGISLPAQRERCEPKCAELGADVVREFVEPGRSATSIDKRPVFQEMLAWVKEQGDIDYIVVYHFNRIFRNSIDRAITKRDLAKCGTRIVSTAVDLGEGPESDMVETILSAVDEYQSAANGADISYKMSAKAKNGGTLGRAPLGYLNKRDTSGGRNIGITVLDEERAASRQSGLRAVCHRQVVAGRSARRTDAARPAYSTQPLPVWPGVGVEVGRNAARPVLHRVRPLQGRDLPGAP